MKPIKSSEIASYLFCPVSWWLGITKGVKITTAMHIGEKHHERISRNQPAARSIYITIIIAVVLILAFVLYWVLA